MNNLTSTHYRTLIWTALLTILLLGCSQKDPETHVNIRIRNMSDYQLEEINLGHGRQNGADYSTGYLRFGRRHFLESHTYTEYKSMLPNVANYSAVELRTMVHSHQNVHFTGHENLMNSTIPVTRDPLEAGKYYTFEFDLGQDPKYDYRFDVIYFNIIEDPPPSDN